jgi:hypothetical protein
LNGFLPNWNAIKEERARCIQNEGKVNIGPFTQGGLNDVYRVATIGPIEESSDKPVEIRLRSDSTLESRKK